MARKVNDTIRGTHMRFTSIPAKLSKQLLEFALRSDTPSHGGEIKINGVVYTTCGKSINIRFSSVSVYYTARGRFYRISDHWSYINSRGKRANAANLNSVGSIGINKAIWTLAGSDNSFIMPAADYYVSGGRFSDPDDDPHVVVSAHVYEGGYCPRFKREF